MRACALANAPLQRASVRQQNDASAWRSRCLTGRAFRRACLSIGGHAASIFRKNSESSKFKETFCARRW